MLSCSLLFSYIFLETDPSCCICQSFVLFALMYNVPLFEYIMSYGCWIVFSLVLLWITLLKTFSCVSFGVYMYSYHLAINPEVKLLSNSLHMFDFIKSWQTAFWRLYSTYTPTEMCENSMCALSPLDNVMILLVKNSLIWRRRLCKIFPSKPISTLLTFGHHIK